MSTRLSPFIGRLAVSCAVAITLYPLPLQAAWFNLIPSEIPETPFAEWQTMKRDALVVDTETNIGYLVHEDGGFTSFPVATGQKRVVRYIGRTYNAQTPARRWVMAQKQIKGDRITFGKEGLFLRLYYEGEETAYGIHDHRSADKMLAEDLRYRSMGCIIVSKETLDNIEATFDMNDGIVDVVTVNGFSEESVNYVTLKNVLRREAVASL